MLGGRSDALGLRVRLERQKLTVGAEDLVFVEMTGAQARDEQFPEPADISHRHPPAVPAVEVADDADPARIRRPHREGDALDTLMHQRMRSELAVAREVVALGKQMDVDLAEHRRKRIDVIEFVLRAAARHPQPIAERLLAVGEWSRQRNRRGGSGQPWPQLRQSQTRRPTHPVRRAASHGRISRPASCACRETRTGRHGAPRRSPRPADQAAAARSAPSDPRQDAEHALAAECRPSRAGSPARRRLRRSPFRA